MKDPNFKKLKELIKYKKALNQLEKLENREHKELEKDRKVFDRNTAKAAKAIMTNDIKKGKSDPHSNG